MNLNKIIKYELFRYNNFLFRFLLKRKMIKFRNEIYSETKSAKIKICNNVAIGSNAVVTKDIEDNTIVVGIPTKTIFIKILLNKLTIFIKEIKNEKQFYSCVILS